MYCLGLERNGYTTLSRFPSADKKLIEKFANCLNKRFPSRKYVVKEISQELPLSKQTDNIRH